MSKFLVLPDGQLVKPEIVIAVKKVKFSDGDRCVRLVLSGDYGVVDINCEDELQQMQMLKEITDLVLRQAGDDPGNIKH